MTEHSAWDLSPPPDSELADRDVPREGEHLAGKRIALLVTGGIAAYRTPTLARGLRRQGADVVAFASSEGLRYVARDALEWATTNPVIERLTPRAEHLSDEAPFDAFLVAPATYNTINKVAHGIADTTVTATLASALGRLERGQTKVLVVPTMHGSLHTSILTESLERLSAMGVQVVAPREDYGKHNIPDEHVLVAEVCRAASRSLLRGVSGVVTGGPTPVLIDGVRRITNRFSGRLGNLIAEELYLRGADVHLIQGQSSVHPPEYLPSTMVRSYDDYRTTVLDMVSRDGCTFGVFSAAVADYKPRETLPGKTPSGREWSIEMVPTAKVIREVREAAPHLHMVVFKLEEGVSHERLIEIARERLGEGYQAVVANRGEEMGPPPDRPHVPDEHLAYILTEAGERAGKEPARLVGKRGIARGVADHLERTVGR